MTVRRYAGAWVKANGSATANAFVPLTFAPGEAYQFDSHGDVRVKTDSKIPSTFVRYPRLSQITGPGPLPAPVQTHIRSPQ
jgi:hypothetical protein